MSMARQAVTRLTLDMSLNAVQKSVAISKGDTNRRMEITLTDAGRPFTLPSTWTATLSGGQMEDGCVVERGRILYDLSSGALTAEAGIFELGFHIFDEEGDEVATPMITCNVYDAERNTEAVASTEEFSVLKAFIENINEVGERLDGLNTRLRLSLLTIPVSEWSDASPYQALAWITPGLGFGENETTKAFTALLIPLNEETRREAQKTELRVENTVAFTGSGSIEVILKRDNYVPSVPMEFVVVSLMTDNPNAGAGDAFKASASFVGVVNLPDELMEGEVKAALDRLNLSVDRDAIANIVTDLVPAWARNSTPPAETDPNVPPWAKKASKPTYTPAEIGLGNVANERQYSEANPPPYPVRSINGKTGDVAMNATDVGADPWGTAVTAVSEHDTDPDAHEDLRDALEELSTRLNGVLNSDDKSLDDLKEIVAYIKSNKTLIDNITSSKVNVTDIINNLTTNVTGKPLSAAQGVVIKSLIDALDTAVKALDSNKMTSAQVSAAIGTALTAYITASKAAELYQPKGNYATAEDLAGAITIGSVSIAPGQWADSNPTLADVTVDGLNKGMVAFLFPANDQTKVAAAAARLTAEAVPFDNLQGGSIVYLVRAEVDTAPSINLDFMTVVFKDESYSASNSARVVLVGVDSYGIGEALTKEEIQTMIDTSLGVIENGTY